MDDVEFWFPQDKDSIVEYRSASRVGNFDFDVNRRRIKVQSHCDLCVCLQIKIVYSLSTCCSYVVILNRWKRSDYSYFNFIKSTLTYILKYKSYDRDLTIEIFNYVTGVATRVAKERMGISRLND